VKLERYPETLAIVELGPGADVPKWAESSSLFAVIATATETTVVCAARNVPTKSRHERPFTAFHVHGTSEEIDKPAGTRTIATLSGDWFLVPGEHADAAAEEWRRSGHDVEPATPIQQQGQQK
jgi:uncharacterized protein